MQPIRIKNIPDVWQHRRRPSLYLRGAGRCVRL